MNKKLKVTPDMARTRQTRKRNMMLLAGLHESVAAFCRAIGSPKCVYWTICGSKATRTCGEWLARKIERKLKLDKGWMDVDH